MKKMILALGIFCCFVALNSFAIPNSLPADRLRDIQALNKQADQAATNVIELEKLKNSLEQYARKRSLECQFAFGHQKFCDCLNHNLPVIIDFHQYIDIMTTDKTKLMSKLNAEDKKIANIVFSARDACIAKF